LREIALDKFLLTLTLTLALHADSLRLMSPLSGLGLESHVLGLGFEGQVLDLALESHMLDFLLLLKSRIMSKTPLLYATDEMSVVAQLSTRCPTFRRLRRGRRHQTELTRLTPRQLVARSSSTRR